MKKYLTEFVGTFFLVLSIGLAVTQQLPMAPLAIGATLMVMVFMGGHVSGAHYNPAVSIALVIRGALPASELVPYIIAQLLGAAAAAFTSFIITGQGFAPAPGEGVSVPSALLVEIFYTFALALVVMNVATAKATQGNGFYGLAIGFTIVAAAFAGGAISGGAYNPAVGTGPTLVNAFVGGGTFQHLWLYWVGPIAGGALAALVFKVQEG